MRGVIADAVLAFICAIIFSLCAAAWCVYMVFGVRLVDIDTWIANGREPWMVAQHEALGVGWVNATKVYSPLLSPIEEAGAPPSWAVNAMSPMNQYQPSSRVAALGAGWPMIQVVRVWEEPLRFVFMPIAAGIDAIPWFALSFYALRLYRSRSERKAAANAIRASATLGSPPAATP